MQIIFIVGKRYMRREWLGVMYLSALLKKHDFTVKVCPTDLDQVRDEVENGPPTVLAYSTPSLVAAQYLEFNRQIRKVLKRKVWSVFGGPHPTYYPEMIEDESVDAICRGEGEEATLEFMTLLRDGKSPVDCRNWHVKDEKGNIHRNPLRPLMENLDDLPFPDRTLFQPPHYMPFSFMAGRGCPFGCTYCFNRAYNKLYGLKKPTLRRRSVDSVVAELDDLKTSGRAFAFQSVDDIFCFPPIAWLEEFAEKYTARVGLPLGGNVRANLVTQDVAHVMKKSGFFAVAMGVECGNEDIRKNILKRHMSNEMIINAGSMLRKAGIRVSTYNLLGLPGGSFETDLETLKLNLAFRPIHGIAFILGAYKGTEIYDIAQSMGMLCEDFVNEMKDSSREMYGWHPHLKFKNEREALRVENLHKLFGLTIGFPFLYRFLPWLSDRRWTRFYGFVSLWYFRFVLVLQIFALMRAIRRCGHLGRFLSSWFGKNGQVKGMVDAGKPA